MTTFTTKTCQSPFMGRPGCRLPRLRLLMAAAGDRPIGGLWAELLDGRCRFVMLRDKRPDVIEASLA